MMTFVGKTAMNLPSFIHFFVLFFSLPFRQSHRQERESHPGDCGQIWRGACPNRGRQRQKASPRGGRQAGGRQGRHCQQQRGEWTGRLVSHSRVTLPSPAINPIAKLLSGSRDRVCFDSVVSSLFFFSPRRHPVRHATHVCLCCLFQCLSDILPTAGHCFKVLCCFIQTKFFVVSLCENRVWFPLCSLGLKKTSAMPRPCWSTMFPISRFVTSPNFS